MAVIHERPNRASPEEAASFVEEFDRLEQKREAKIAELDAEFKRKKREIVKAIKGEQDAVLADAKSQGVKKGVIRALADPQKKRRKADELRAKADEQAEQRIDDLEEDDQEFAIDIRDALGSDFASFGLGAAAIEREESEGDGTDPVAKAAQDAWDEEDAKQPEPAE